MSAETEKKEFEKLDKEYIVNVYNRLDAVLDHGKGSLVYDVNGKEYIDLSAGIAVNVFGVCDDVWEKAVINQLGKLSHMSNVFYTEPQIILAKKLCEKTGMKKVFFSNSGAETNECAIKAARKYSHDKYGDGRYTIITLKNSFHGRTMATLTACGQESLHQDFGPFLPGFVYAEPDNFESVKKLAEENKTCAIMMELVQQTGNGRTGALYAYMRYGIQPDIVTTAKAIGGGLPFAVTMFADSCQHALTDHTHGSTFGGNPICAAGAISIIDRLDDDLMADVLKKGEYVKQELESCQNVEWVSGLGLMIGVKLKKDLMEVVNGCVDAGVLVLTANGLLRLLPPLILTADDVDDALAILRSVLEKCV